MSFNEGFSTQGIPIVTASDGQVLTWSSAQGAWIAADPSGGGAGFTGVTLDPTKPNLEGIGTSGSPLKVKDNIDVTSVTASVVTSNKIIIGGAVYTELKTKTTNYLLDSSTDYIVAFSGSNLTGALPTANALKGLTFVVKNTHNTPVHISSSAGIKIDGENFVVIDKQYNSYTFVSDGNNWLIV